ncbi:MAG: hypothetical protein J4452_00875 [Candidatus Aenigmarchaeota archaeon]|nr:hypothetical protein [Candidatus Aenigmarchaeota archaeon]
MIQNGIVVETEDVSLVYKSLLEKIMKNGDVWPGFDRKTKKDIKVKEVRPFLLISTNPRKRVINPTGRNLNLPAVLRDASDLLEGLNPGFRNRYDSYFKYWNRHKSDGTVPWTYGELMRGNGTDQLENVFKLLKANPVAKGRSIIYFHPNDSASLYPELSYPGIIDLHYRIYDNKLACWVDMRANDIMKGFPYNFFSVTTLQEILAGWLKMDVGNCYWYVHFAQVYEPQFNRVDEIGSDSVYQEHHPIPLNVPRKEFKKNWGLKELVEKNARKGKYRLAERTLSRIEHPAYASWAGTMLFAEMERGRHQGRKVYAEDLERVNEHVKNEFGAWTNRRLLSYSAK